MNPKDILEKYYHFAVVGVTPNQEKYGYKIFKRLFLTVCGGLSA